MVSVAQVSGPSQVTGASVVTHTVHTLAMITLMLLTLVDVDIARGPGKTNLQINQSELDNITFNQSETYLTTAVKLFSLVGTQSTIETQLLVTQFTFSTDDIVTGTRPQLKPGGQCVVDQLSLGEVREENVSNPELAETTVKVVGVLGVEAAGANDNLTALDIIVEVVEHAVVLQQLLIVLTVHNAEKTSLDGFDLCTVPRAISQVVSEGEALDDVTSGSPHHNLQSAFLHTQDDVLPIRLEKLQQCSLGLSPEPELDGLDVGCDCVINGGGVGEQGVLTIEGHIGHTLVTVAETVTRALLRTREPVTPLRLLAVAALVTSRTLAEVIIPGHVTAASVLTRILTAGVITHFSLLDGHGLDLTQASLGGLVVQLVQVDNLGHSPIAQPHILDDTLEEIVFIINIASLS